MCIRDRYQRRVHGTYGLNKLSTELQVGEMTLKDIIKELKKPGRDPREEMPKPILKTGIIEMKDLKPGMVLSGTVRNVSDFGAFVDIGVHQDGLVHKSQMANRFVKHPLDIVKVGDIVKVAIIEVDVKRKRISLTMKDIDEQERVLYQSTKYSIISSALLFLMGECISINQNRIQFIQY
eukprot:TRINITY_DN21548_c0_g1_i1.p3 TRINITY_DN21548_c0_g1~~TRINITY_DN21548_c0_g1_i1.p3  ORF type:complete len:179 (-),score=23.88 TRINITY_DN21548_c0_g1_i1:790-1326(-)